MILQALKEYYDRMAADPDSGIALEGWEWKEIPFVFVLNDAGELLDIEDTRENRGKKLIAKRFLVPQGVKRAAGIAANLLWDVPGYVLGIMNTEGLEKDKIERSIARAPAQKAAFIDRIRNELADSLKKAAIIRFLSTISLDVLEQYPQWPDVHTQKSNITFRFEDERELYCRSEEVTSRISEKLARTTPDGSCLITGESDHIANLHIAIKGVWGAQPTGANIVSFNLDAFRSYGKHQGGNAPIGETSMSAYTKALNTLLSKESRQRLQVGDASTIFWSAKKTQFEKDFAFFFNEPEKDDPNAGTDKIRTLLEAPNTGTYLEDDGNLKFFILGLSPNAARLSIRFWEVGTVQDIAKRIRQHFIDTQIIKPQGESEFYSLWRLLVNIAVQDKSENIPPNIAGDVMRSIISALPYPKTLLHAALRRMKSDAGNRFKPERAALVKAYLNRYSRFYPNDKEKELYMALDSEQPSIGYQLGRLFAVLEKIQEEANPGINATIRDRYYGAACSSPVTVFPTLMRLKNHHLGKIDNKGRIVNMEKLIAEIVGRFSDFPAHLALHEQGKFAIGYYHQRQDFFARKENDQGKETTNGNF